MGFSEGEIEKVWRSGIVISGMDSNVWRRDHFGAWIKREDYGKRDSRYGWEIGNIEDNGEEFNLRPLQWENSIRKKTGSISCPVKAVGE